MWFQTKDETRTLSRTILKRNSVGFVISLSITISCVINHRESHRSSKNYVLQVINNFCPLLMVWSAASKWQLMMSFVCSLQSLLISHGKRLRTKADLPKGFLRIALVCSTGPLQDNHGENENIAHNRSNAGVLSELNQLLEKCYVNKNMSLDHCSVTHLLRTLLEIKQRMLSFITLIHSDGL